MPRYTPIAPGMSIIADNSFGEYNRRIVHGLLKNVQDTFAGWIGMGWHKDRKTIIIEYKEDCPTTYDDFINTHLIKLCVRGNDYRQWAFQFAHEYCHHLIDGPMVTARVGLEWFEEVLCHIASWAYLGTLKQQCSRLGLDQSYQSQIQDWIPPYSAIPQSAVREYIASNAPLLYIEECRRGIYQVIASALLPLFESNPNLWRIVLHIGDSRRWSSLAELFAHLEQTADDSYIDSLKELKNLIV